MRSRVTIRFFAALLIAHFSYVGCSPLDSIQTTEDEPRHIDNKPYQIEEVPITSDAAGWDIPANDGIRNALLNAEQLVKLSYVPAGDFPTLRGVYSAGSTIQGMIYSSTRYEDLFCPNNVSLWTFMSSLLNPNSYLLTKDIKEPPYSIRGQAKPIYGQVCTQFVQYALGIKYNFQIYQMTVWDGFDRVVPQNIDKMRLGDVLTTLKGHTKIVTGIRREEGHVVEVAVSESVPGNARRIVYPVNDILESFDDGYIFYRYRYINDTKHIESPFVNVGNETAQGYTNLLVKEVVPRRGDKANWRKDEPVVLDVLDRDGYTNYKLYKDREIIAEKPLPSDNIIDLGIMPYGSYKLCLTDGKIDSRFVYWIVVDYSISAMAIGKAKVIIRFESKNATPIWATWRIPQKKDSDYNNGPLWTTVITENDCGKGMVLTELDPYLVKGRGLGEWDFKVAFETDYGIISSDSETVCVY